MNNSRQSITTEPAKISSCTSCGAARNQGDHCHYCDAIYLDTVNQKTTEPAQSSLASKYKIVGNGNELKIMWNWKSKTAYLLIPFFLFWNSIAFSFFDLKEAIENPLSLIPIPGIHLIVGILGPLYIALQLINKTTIVVTSKYLSIKHHPIPWGKNHRFSKDQIDYLYVSKAQISSKHRTWDVPVLQLVKPNGTRQQLLKGTQSVEFADYESLRQRISKALNIPLIGHDHGPD